MSYNLFLDDIRSPMCLGDTKTWEVVRSYDAFVDKITKDGLPQCISFDHDLSAMHYPLSFEEGMKPIDYSDERYYKEKTGYHCALWLTNYCQEKNLPLPNWQVHSMNPMGRINIAQLLQNYERRNATSES